MPKPRFSGGSVSMRVSSSQMVPPESGSRPAMQLSAVDLPQPDGPSSAMNSPRRTVSVSSSSALNAWPPAPANRRVTRSSRSSLKSCFMQVLALRRVARRKRGIQPGGHRVERRRMPALGRGASSRRGRTTRCNGRRVATGRDDVTWSSARPPAGPRCGTPRPAPSPRATACAGTPSAIFSYSGRPNSLIASWLSFGAIDSGTFFTAGPG